MEIQICVPRNPLDVAPTNFPNEPGQRRRVLLVPTRRQHVPAWAALLGVPPLSDRYPLDV